MYALGGGVFFPFSFSFLSSSASSASSASREREREGTHSLLTVAAVEMANKDDQRGLPDVIAETGERAGLAVCADDQQGGGLAECFFGREEVCCWDFWW